MMFRVSSTQPVIYLAGSRFYAREVQALDVNADTPEYAIRHFLKVTTGDAGEIVCVPIEKMDGRPAAIAEPDDNTRIVPAGLGMVTDVLVP